MKVGIYHEIGEGDELGGTELTVAVLADALRHRYQVEIINHAPSLTLDRLADFSQLNLEGVHLRNMFPSSQSHISSQKFWNRYRLARLSQASLSSPYDIFVNFAHGLPPFCHAKKGVLAVNFPFFSPSHVERRSWSQLSEGSVLRRHLQRTYYKWEWKMRLSSYHVTLANSKFTQLWTRRRWGIECQLVYPPVDTSSLPSNKKDLIISVGRFSTRWHRKKQEEIVDAFRHLEVRLPTWEYLSVGALGDLKADRDFFEVVQKLAAGSRVRLASNLRSVELKKAYEQAKIFWHATGYGEDDQTHPERAEHFGMVTVEAMAAGCVPVVINKGGQPEIVEHGVNGFLWNTLAELREYTLVLANDEKLLARMSEAARCRANHFSRKNFVDQFLALIETLVSQAPSRAVSSRISKRGHRARHDPDP